MNLYNEDCLIALKNIPDESVDLIVTDCPYHIVGGGCSNGEYGNGKNKNPGEIFGRRRIGYREKGGYILEGTKHIGLGGVLDDNNAITYARQGKLFKHNDIDFSDWLPELYRVLKPSKHIYI
jgi:site-specific DNA-methyltransferase (adenine-specific)